MDDAKFQELVLQQFEQINKCLEKTDIHLDKMDAHTDSLGAGQALLIKHVTDLESGQTEVRQSIVRMENELTGKVRALFDAREVQNNINERILSCMERIEAKVDVLQLETASIRRIK